MSQVQTEGVNLAVVPEATLGAAVPPTTGWYNLQPNSLGSLGPQMKKVPRDPISKNRQKQKGILVDMDSTVSWEADVTKDIVDIFHAGMFMSAVKHNGGKGQTVYRPTAVTATGYTVPAAGDYAINFMVIARNFSTAANNGLKTLIVGSTPTEIKTSGLVAEAAPPATAMVEICGFQGVAGDIGIDASGNLTSTASVFTSWGLQVGQWIRLCDLAAGAAFAFANTAYVGFARVKAIAAGLITLERRSWTVGAADAGAGKTIRVFFGRWARNVASDHADYATPSFAFEVTYPNLGGVGVPEYEYPLGNHVDEWVWNLSLTDKATVQMMFTGTSTADPASARMVGPSTAANPTTNLAVSTSTDLSRLRISNVDETGISTDFQNIKITFANNVEPQKQLGTLGAVLLNVGKFEVTVEADCIFTSDSVVKAVRDNRTCSMDVVMRNGDFGALIDVSSMTIDSTDRKFETNKSVMISAKSTGFQDAVTGFTCGMTVFPYLPA